MNKEQFTNLVKTRHATSLQPTAEPYTAPDIEVIDIELENCFAASPLPGFDDGGDWD